MPSLLIKGKRTDAAWAGVAPSLSTRRRARSAVPFVPYCRTRKPTWLIVGVSGQAQTKLSEVSGSLARFGSRKTSLLRARAQT